MAKARMGSGWHKESLRHRQAKVMGKAPSKLHFIKSPPLRTSNNLPVQVSMIVPSTKDKSKKISQAEFNSRVDETKKKFDMTFGGDTSVTTVGSYFDGKSLIKERGAKVESSTTIEKYNENISEISKFAEKKGEEWGQDTMAVGVEGRTFITPKKDYIDDDLSTKKEDILVN